MKVNKVLFRKMRTKWASCSSKENITVNSLAQGFPDNLLEYLLSHEVAHIPERHNRRFWGIVSTRFPNHEELESELFSYWFLIWGMQIG